MKWEQVYREEREHLGLTSNQQPTALCLSGGGIRSATFALGLLQGLARVGLLDKFDYLSTVSGGGYIGSWFAAWIHRDPHGVRGVVDALKRPSAEVPHPLKYLRDYSDYLSPKLGLFSADTWTLIGIYLRNLFLNWCVLIPAILAVLLVPRLAITILEWLAAHWSLSVQCATLGLGLVAATFAVEQVGSYRVKRRSQSNNQGPTRGTVLRLCVSPLLVAMVLMVTYWTLRSYKAPTEPAAEQVLGFLGAGAAVHFVAWLIYSARGLVRRTEKATAAIVEGIVVMVSGAVGGVVVWAAATKIMPPPFQHLLVYVCFAGPVFLVAFLAAATLFVGLTAKFTLDADREWWGRFGSLILMVSVGWAGLSSIVVFGPMLLVWLWDRAPALVTAMGGVSGVVALLGGRSGRTSANAGAAGKSDPFGTILHYATVIAAPVFLIVTLTLLSLGTSILLEFVHRQWPSVWSLSAEAMSSPPGHLPAWLYDEIAMSLKPADPMSAHVIMILATPPCVHGSLLVILLVIANVSALWIDINEFSLHAMYRDRLIRAYLGASRLDSAGQPQRKPDLFTNIDPEDDIIPIGELDRDTKGAALTKGSRWWELIDAWPAMDDVPEAAPLLVVNIALNLVKEDKPAWQERKAASFTVTPLHAGSEEIGYCDAKNYAGGISLGTALTISGAAASPNMGYHSSPAVTFLMTLFNLRLGLWLGNPDRAAAGRRSPRWALRPMIREACGLTDDKSTWVYLSDGGHFENLGLYEMVRRRCRPVVVVDAGCDPDCRLEDLGNAIRKIRVDQGIRIDLEAFSIYSRTKYATLKGDTGRYAVLGTIHYTDVGEQEDGTLVYLKPAIYGDEPKDIFTYSQRSLTFPHETTVNQFFTESQFESYRMLGLFAIETICGRDSADMTLDQFVSKVKSCGDACGA